MLESISVQKIVKKSIGVLINENVIKNINGEKIANEMQKQCLSYLESQGFQQI